MKEKNNFETLKVEEITTEGYSDGFYTIIKQMGSVLDGFSEAVDDAVQAVLDNKENDRIVQIVIDDTRRNYTVSDNGCGMSRGTLMSSYKKCMQTSWATFIHGIMGLGRFVFAGICGRMGGGEKESIMRIITSVGDEYAHSVQLTLGDDEYTRVHPLFGSGINKFEKDDFNIHNGKLKGTIQEMVNGEQLPMIEEIVFYLGKKFAKKIIFDDLKIYINGIRIEPIDVTHDILINDEFSVRVTETEKFVTVNKLVKFYHKDNRDDIHEVQIKCTLCMSPDYLREHYEWERNAKFNTLGGVYVDLNGNLIEMGGNTQSMFHQNISLGHTKCGGMYGDVVGNLTGFNRLTIFLKTVFDAKLFGVKAIKSTGIINLFYNEKLCNEYYVSDGVSLYEMICHIRRFCHLVYQTYLKPYKIEKSNNWSNAKEIITKRYEDFDFEKNDFINRKLTKKEKIQQGEAQKYFISHKSCMFKFSYTLSKDGYKIDEPKENEDNEVIKKIKEKIGTKSANKSKEIIKHLKNSHYRMLAIGLECGFQHNALNALLIGASKYDSKKFATL